MKKSILVIKPKSDLGKLLLALVQSVGSSVEPLAFVKIDVVKAIKQADSIKIRR